MFFPFLLFVKTPEVLLADSLILQSTTKKEFTNSRYYLRYKNRTYLNRFFHLHDFEIEVKKDHKLHVLKSHFKISPMQAAFMCNSSTMGRE